MTYNAFRTTVTLQLVKFGALDAIAVRNQYGNLNEVIFTYGDPSASIKRLASVYERNGGSATVVTD